MEYYRPQNKTCATCGYWTGNRQIGDNGRAACTENQAVKGDCQHPKFRTTGKSAGNSCPRNAWEKWQALK